MNRFHCDKEAEITSALRGGTLQAELARHAASCTICADTLLVSQFLLARKKAECVLPDADSLWWKAQLARKQMAVERATQSIALVRKVGYGGLAAAGLWLVFARGYLASAITALSNHELWPAGALSQSALFMGVGALVFTLLGSLYLARPEK
ncbi:MAG TPA: hypothetical protein VHM93_00420 [Candidatus Acidoferrum sp.]|jgi:hypothetical protein|nr:hypothetical protein [Candidatus Acidoferrum sp.]